MTIPPHRAARGQHTRHPADGRSSLRKHKHRPLTRAEQLRPVGRMLMQMLGMFAEFERAAMIERIRGALRAKSKKGGWRAGRPPYGYTTDSKKLYLVPIVEEAAVVQKVFEMYVRDKHGSRVIAAALNAQGLRTRTGRLWSHRAVGDILKNEVYTGKIYYDGVWHDAPHAPIVDADTFKAANATRTTRTEERALRASNPARYELTGRIVCQRCNTAYVGTSAHGRTRHYRYYTCHNRLRYGTTRCDNDRIPADALETAIIDSLVEVYADSKIFEAAVAAYHASTLEPAQDRSDELARLETQITSTRGKIRKYQLAFEDGTMPGDACGERIRELNDQLTQACDEHNTLKIQIETPPEPPTLAEIGDIQELIRSVLLPTAPPAHTSGPDPRPALRKATLHALVEEIRVDGRNKIEPRFRIPTRDTVRIPDGSVETRGLEPLTPALQSRSGSSAGVHARPYSRPGLGAGSAVVPHRPWTSAGSATQLATRLTGSGHGIGRRRCREP
ncbi:recombinase family protein [Parafrankia sp. FMc6]|uniref:recombinase family protein n=1 Tax=Parafrankia soli TaxID=2599596 RepID=UPI0034D61FB0